MEVLDKPWMDESEISLISKHLCDTDIMLE